MVSINIIKNILRNFLITRLMRDFALFHAQRMRGVYQSDNEYYVKQSLLIFFKEKYEKNIGSM